MTHILINTLPADPDSLPLIEVKEIWYTATQAN